MLPLQLLINGLVTGCALGVVAVSFSLVYATTKIFHVAHAGVYTLAGYLAWWLVSQRSAEIVALLRRDRRLRAAGRVDPRPGSTRSLRSGGRDASGGADRLAGRRWR